MQDTVIDEPYEFVPPHYGKIWPKFIKLFIGRVLRRNYGVHTIETRGAERLQKSIAAGQGILVAPNHCRMCDPLLLSPLSLELRCEMHAMASWHLFKQGWLMKFLLQKIGAFSVYREGLDRRALDTAIDMLVQGKRPLVVFPEGAVSRHNDVVMQMLEGTSFVARTAAKRRLKQGNTAGVVVHPVAIRYFFGGDIEATVTPVLEEIESHFSWYPQRNKSIIVRLQQIGQALLSLKEVEYLGAARTGDFYERVEHLIEDVLERLERKWNVKTGEDGDGVVARVKDLRAAILPDMISGKVTAAERHECWKDLAACYYVQQMSHYPRHYVRRSEKNIVEHILETAERFEEDFTDVARVHGPLHAVVQVGEPIPVGTERVRGGAADPVMTGIREQLTAMLGELAMEARVV